MFVFSKGKTQSGSKYDHKGVFNKHIGEVLSSAKADLPLSTFLLSTEWITKWAYRAPLCSIMQVRLSLTIHEIFGLGAAISIFYEEIHKSFSKW
jgi:hypothetical protein